ncbi:hypothetical protein [Streptomyces longwoodensis]|uniref:hypothetical protein n=1 Tax=Streptomyces longwoodensis TaxID=68231 RepID=UPI0033D4D94E
MSVKSPSFRAAALSGVVLAGLGAASLAWSGAATAATAEDPQVVVSEKSPGRMGTVTARCPAGKRVVGGGYQDTVPRYDAFGNVITSITANAPTADGSGWTVSVRHGQVRAYARCVTGEDPQVVVSEKSPGGHMEQMSARMEVWITGHGTVTARCPAGKRVVGGGYRETEVNIDGFGKVRTTITANAPTADGTGWTTSVTDGQVRAYALCTTPAT